MSKPTKTSVPAAPPASIDPHVIRPTAVYFPDQARRFLRLRKSTLAREIRAGRLRVSKRAGQYYFLGAWLLRWLRGGLVDPPSRRRPAPVDSPANGRSGSRPSTRQEGDG